MVPARRSFILRVYVAVGKGKRMRGKKKAWWQSGYLNRGQQIREIRAGDKLGGRQFTRRSYEKVRVGGTREWKKNLMSQEAKSACRRNVSMRRDPTRNDWIGDTVIKAFAWGERHKHVRTYCLWNRLVAYLCNSHLSLLRHQFSPVTNLLYYQNPAIKIGWTDLS